jgi:hypothetical protein
MLAELAEFLDKGKPVVRLGRKAMGLDSEIARLPKGKPSRLATLVTS